MLRRKVYHIQVGADLCRWFRVGRDHNIGFVKTDQLFELSPCSLLACLIANCFFFRNTAEIEKLSRSTNSEHLMRAIYRAI